ncbi:MAG: hypothetical protein Q7K39_00290 [Candidatus Magasanikbacteria bacterium]|nr:hypothetical protein [Candidatus Magasanikbacteria bacterium]
MSENLEAEQIRGAVQQLFARAGYTFRRGDAVVVKFPDTGNVFRDAIVADFGFNPLGKSGEPAMYIRRPEGAPGPTDMLFTLQTIGECIEKNSPVQPQNT